MADPVTMAVISTAISAGGTLLAGRSAQQQSDYQATIARMNARQAGVNAKNELAVAQRDQEDIGAQNAGLLGKQAATQGASGVAIDSPSAARARFRAREIAYEDIYRRAEEGNLRYANLKTQGNAFNADAKAHRSAGRSAMLSSLVSAAGSVSGNFANRPTAPNVLATKDVTPRFFTPGSGFSTGSFLTPTGPKPRNPLGKLYGTGYPGY